MIVEDESIVALEMALFKHKLERELRIQREWLDATLQAIGDGVIGMQAGECYQVHRTGEGTRNISRKSMLPGSVRFFQDNARLQKGRCTGLAPIAAEPSRRPGVPRG